MCECIIITGVPVCSSVLQCASVCFSVVSMLQCAPVRFSVLQYASVRFSVLQYAPVRFSVPIDALMCELAGVEMSLTADTVSTALAATPERLLAIDFLMKLLNLPRYSKELQASAITLVRELGLVVFKDDIIVLDPQWTITLIGEVLLQSPACLGNNCSLCAMRLALALPPGCGQERTVPKNVADRMLQIAIIKATLPREYSADAYKRGLVNSDLLYYLVKQYCYYTHPGMSLKKSLIYHTTSNLNRMLHPILACDLVASMQYAEATGFEGIYRFLPILVPPQPIPNVAKPLVVEFTITPTHGPTVAEAMTFYNRMRTLMSNCHTDRPGWDGLMVTPTTFHARFAVGGWGVHVQQVWSQPIVARLYDLGPDPGNVYQKEPIFAVDDLGHGVAFGTGRDTSRYTVQVTGWEMDCPDCDSMQPTWEQIVAQDVGCTRHHRTKNLESPPEDSL